MKEQRHEDCAEIDLLKEKEEARRNSSLNSYNLVLLKVAGRDKCIRRGVEGRRKRGRSKR